MTSTLPQSPASPFSRRVSPLSERDIQRVLLVRLNQIPGVLAYRVNTLVARAGPRTIRSVRKGHADILACARGRFVAIEVKSPTGRQSDAQSRFQSFVEAAGGRYLLARDVNSTLEAVRRILED